MSTHWLQHLRRLFVGDEKELAERAVQHSHSQAALASPDQTFLTALGSPQANVPSIHIGHLASNQTPVTIPLSDMAGVSRWSVGATGSGKSVQVLSEEAQLLPHYQSHSLVHLDAKSESAKWLSELFLPAFLSQWPHIHQQRFLSHFRMINPFDGQNLPQLNVVKPIPNISVELQAKEVADLIAESASTHYSGPRMQGILSYVLRLAISLTGLSLIEVRSMLVNSAYLNGLLKFCQDREVSDYFVFRFPKESRESINAVIARLDALLLLPDTKRSLAAENCLDIPTLLERGWTIIDIGNPPRGAEHVSHFWMGMFVRSLARAIMNRPTTPRTLPCFCVMDEWWLGVNSELAFHFERLLSLARFKKVSLWLLNQLPGQIGTKYPELLETLKNSIGMQISFRQSYEDAMRLAYMLPITGSLYIPRGPHAAAWDAHPATPTEERQFLVQELARLPDRTFYFYYKKRGLQAVKLIAPTVNFNVVKAAASTAPLSLREACLGRHTGLNRHALDQTLNARYAHIQHVASGRAVSPIPTFSTTTPSPLAHTARPTIATTAPTLTVARSPQTTSNPRSKVLSKSVTKSQAIPPPLLVPPTVASAPPPPAPPPFLAQQPETPLAPPPVLGEQTPTSPQVEDISEPPPIETQPQPEEHKVCEPSPTPSPIDSQPPPPKKQKERKNKKASTKTTQKSHNAPSKGQKDDDDLFLG